MDSNNHIEIQDMEIQDPNSQSSSEADSGDLIPKDEVLSPSDAHFQYDIEIKSDYDYGFQDVAPAPVTYLSGYQDGPSLAPDFAPGPAPAQVTFIQPVVSSQEGSIAPNNSFAPTTVPQGPLGPSSPLADNLDPQFHYTLMPYNPGQPKLYLKHIGPAPEGYQNDPEWQESVQDVGGPIWIKGRCYYLVDNRKK